MAHQYFSLFSRFVWIVSRTPVIIPIIITLCEFFTSVLRSVFLLKSPRVFSVPLCIVTDLNSFWVEMVSMLPLIFTSPRFLLSQSSAAVEYTDCIPVESYDPTPKSVLKMTLNNLMVRSCHSGALGNAEYTFIAIALKSSLVRSGSTW